jgi:hypothetical protein
LSILTAIVVQELRHIRVDRSPLIHKVLETRAQMSFWTKTNPEIQKQYQKTRASIERLYDNGVTPRLVPPPKSDSKEALAMLDDLLGKLSELKVKAEQDGKRLLSERKSAAAEAFSSQNRERIAVLAVDDEGRDQNGFEARKFDDATKIVESYRRTFAVTLAPIDESRKQNRERSKQLSGKIALAAKTSLPTPFGNFNIQPQFALVGLALAFPQSYLFFHSYLTSIYKIVIQFREFPGNQKIYSRMVQKLKGCCWYERNSPGGIVS